MSTPNWISRTLAALALSTALLALGAITPAPQLLSKATVHSATANGDSTVAAMSANGRFVVLASSALDLTAGANPGDFAQLYLFDTTSGQFNLVSATPSGAAGHGYSGAPSVSEDGRWVVFENEASDLAPGDTNGLKDIFLRDSVAGTTVRVSATPAPAAAGGGASGAPVMTPDGAWIAFESNAKATNLVTGVTDGNLASDVFLYGVKTGTCRLVSQGYASPQTGTKASWGPVLSADGRRLAFFSLNTGLAADTPATNSQPLLYLHDIAAKTNLWASRGATNFLIGVTNASRLVPWKATFSGDGSFLIYAYGPLVLRYDPASDTTLLVATNLAEAGLALFGPAPIAANADGSVIAFQGSRSNVLDAAQAPDAVFVWREADQSVTRLEVPVADAAAVGQVGGPVVSADGRFVAYQAQILAPTAGFAGPGVYVFRHDLLANTASVASASDATPDEGIPSLWHPVWSADLNRLGFSSDAPGLIAGDNNHAQDAFLLTLEPLELRLLSPRDTAVASVTAAGPSWARPQCLSADGRYLVFTSAAEDLVANDRNGAGDVFLHDLNTGSNSLVSVNLAGTASGNGYSHSPVISADGRFIAFASLANDLVEGDTNGLNDVFVRDLETGTTELASHVLGGTGSGSGSSLKPTISADGRWIAFESLATNLMSPDLVNPLRQEYLSPIRDVFVFDRIARTNQLVTVSNDSTGSLVLGGFSAVMAPDGRRVIFRDGTLIFYVRDLTSQTTAKVQEPPGTLLRLTGTEPQPISISADSKWAAFAGTNATFNSVLVRSFEGDASLVLPARASTPSLSADGQRVAYTFLSNPAAGRQVYVRDFANDTTNLVSVSLDGVTLGNGSSYQPVISGDGRYVVFKSVATNLVPHDTNAYGDIFVRDLAAGRTLLVSATAAGVFPNFGSLSPVIGPDGRTVVFMSWATDLAAGDLNRASDLFVLRLGSGPAADSDEDGLPDDWELTYFNSLVRDGAGDWDGDGMSDRAEYTAGTDPTNEGSALRVLTLSGVGGGGVTVIWSAVPGKTYRVQFKDAVNAPDWTDVPGDVLAASDSASKVDTTAGASEQRFYRAVLVE